MPELDFKEYQPYVFFITGLLFVVIAIFKKASKSYLKQSGLQAEGIVFALAGKPNNTSSIGENLNLKDKITVRFVTQDQEWITGNINQDFAAFFTGQYKEGQSVNVYYDPKDPTHFFVDTKQSEQLSKVIFAAVGCGFSIIGLYQLLT